jgi:hypothetical protein
VERSIEASTTIRARAEAAAEVLLEDPGAVFGEGVTAEERHQRRFTVELTVDLGGGATVAQQVVVRLETASRDPLGLDLPLTWEATGRGRLFPSFAGRVELREAEAGTSLALRGHYAVPLGVIGRFGDGVAGRQLARRSLAALLERMARNLDGEVARRRQAVAWRPAPYPIDLHEHGGDLP